MFGGSYAPTKKPSEANYIVFPPSKPNTAGDVTQRYFYLELKKKIYV
jgi:hypothetical protein